ncbi:MAG: flagellar basal body rod protein FlgB [Clostridia bacterium]
MIDKIFKSKEIVHTALDAAWLRNEVISQNIANVNTPGYKKKSVVFEELLNNAMNENKLPDIKVVENSNTSSRRDGNNVDIDIEMAELAKNTIRYNALVSRAGFSSLKYILKETK